MRVAIYARVSTEQQVDNYSIDFQKERTKAFCASKGWDNITEYIDGGFSGSNTQRPALQKLIKDIDKRLIDVVIVYRLDRLSRSQRDTLFLIEELFLPNNVEFISLNETIDTSTPFGRAMIGILSVFAQLERETINERMRFGRYKRVKDNGYYGGGLAEPLGYRIKEHGILEINEEEAEIVKVIY
ncbi:recombinase family protein, partial [Turicibacter sanguinis]|nr:recombinase family protein [Turicibacter sanguinis]MTP16740.1 recombinase family protein [Turicibacter sanguinis]